MTSIGVNGFLAQLLPVGAHIETKILEAFYVSGVISAHTEDGFVIDLDARPGQVYLSWAAVAAGLRAASS